MDITVLNTDFEPVNIVDLYTSFIWTDRFNKPGDFEYCNKASREIIDIMQKDYYLHIAGSEHTMIIEDYELETNNENGDTIKITGRSLESILDRRIVWETTDIDGNLQNGIKQLINEAFINPTDPNRKVPNFVFQDSTDPKITELTMDHQYTGDNLLEIVQDMCDANDIGFKIILNDSNQFVFSLYAGTDRSYEQTSNEYVVFKPSFDNVITAKYTEVNSGDKNVTLVAGEDRQFSADAEEETLSIDEKETIRITRVIGFGQGLNRRELYTDARDIQKEEDMTDEEYYSKLDQRGVEKLSENSIQQKFDGQYETMKMFVYGRDFFMGDIVEVADNYGNEAPSKIIEFIISHNESGYESYPTFRAHEYND